MKKIMLALLLALTLSSGGSAFGCEPRLCGAPQDETHDHSDDDSKEGTGSEEESEDDCGECDCHWL
ncbi:hypothetical protein [Candidatus Chlamydia corallus]|uniref:hypothetical protein n=1 Tax=Candidatus Chlamydia corallus TaxID=2038470 RepID=UPI000C2FDA5C|nr:hypothetical protein [Candidatus Chlamydia corallus]